MLFFEIIAYQSVNFPRDPSEGKNLLGPDAFAVMVYIVFVVHAVAALDSRRSVVLGVGGPQDGKVGNLDKETGGGLSDEAVPAWRGTRKRD